MLLLISFYLTLTDVYQYCNYIYMYYTHIASIRIFNIPNWTTTFWDLICRKGNLDLSYYILEISCQHYSRGKCVCTWKPSKSLWSHQPTILLVLAMHPYMYMHKKTGFTLINIDAQDMKLWNSYSMRTWSSESCQAVMKQSPKSYKT